MSILKRNLLTLIAAGLVMGLVACKEKGPLEKAEKATDEAIKKTEKAVKEKLD